MAFSSIKLTVLLPLFAITFVALASSAPFQEGNAEAHLEASDDNNTNNDKLTGPTGDDKILMRQTRHGYGHHGHHAGYGGYGGHRYGYNRPVYGYYGGYGYGYGGGYGYGYGGYGGYGYGYGGYGGYGYGGYGGYGYGYGGYGGDGYGYGGYGGYGYYRK